MSKSVRQAKIDEYLERASKAESEGKTAWASLMYRGAERYDAMTDLEAIQELAAVAKRLTERQPFSS